MKQRKLDPLGMITGLDIIYLLIAIACGFKALETGDPVWVICIAVIDMALTISFIARYYMHHVNEYWKD